MEQTPLTTWQFLVKDHQKDGPTFKATRGILFFAVPHRGMDVEDMIKAIKYGNTSERRLDQISKDQSYWRQELDSFVDVIRDFKVASFYETALTRRLIKVSKFSACYRISSYSDRIPMDLLHAMEILQLLSIRVVLLLICQLPWRPSTL